MVALFTHINRITNGGLITAKWTVPLIDWHCHGNECLLWSSTPGFYSGRIVWEGMGFCADPLGLDLFENPQLKPCRGNLNGTET